MPKQRNHINQRIGKSIGKLETVVAHHFMLVPGCDMAVAQPRQVMLQYLEVAVEAIGISHPQRVAEEMSPEKPNRKQNQDQHRTPIRQGVLASRTLEGVGSHRKSGRCTVTWPHEGFLKIHPDHIAISMKLELVLLLRAP